MQRFRVVNKAGGFTLVELLVVIAIIGILVAVLLPSISMIRGKARYTDGTAQFRALETGLEAFRGESALGGGYPPSASDDTTSTPKLTKIADPHALTGAIDVAVTGAHLLVHAMMGADLLGPRGFKDVDNNGFWSNDTFRGPKGLYEVKNDGTVVHTPYGGAGGSYVDEKMKDRVTSLNEMEKKARIAAMNKAGSSDETYNELLFTDPWDRPILYYRANPAARLMVGSQDGRTPGIYRHEDNAIITGHSGLAYKGVDFGAGQNARSVIHEISKATNPDPTPLTPGGDLSAASFDDSFARYIWDPSVKALNQPARKESYLLISAGADGRYGNADDLTNWTRPESR